MAVRSSSRSESNRLGALIVGGLLLTILAVAILSSVIAKRQLDEAALREALAARRAGGDPYIEMEDPFIPLTSVLEAELRGIDVPQALALTSEIAQTHKNWIEGVAVPLRSGSPSVNQDQLESYGKVLVDRLETQVLN